MRALLVNVAFLGQERLSAFGPLRSIEIPLAPCRFSGSPLAPCRVLGQRAGRPHRAAYSLAQMPLWHTMGLARPPWLERVTLQHARLPPAARCSHPTRLLTEWMRVAGEPGPRQPEHQKPNSQQRSGLVLRHCKTRPDPANARAVPTGLRRRASGLRESGPGIPNTKDPASRQAQPGGGDFWGAEERTARVGARSALRHHFGRGCPNAAPAGRAVSSAARPVREHHRAVGAFSARPFQYEPPPGCACRDARQR
jgi:hypothetical protein